MARSTIYPPSVTPGIPRLGERPEGWLETTYGDVLEKVTRKAKIKDKQKYQLVTAKRNRGGIVPRSQLYGKEIKTEGQFYLCTGDFLISKRQIIHGACGIVPETLDGSIVSGEYSALRVKSNLLLDYLKYHYHTVYFQQTCFQSSVGVDVEKMIFDLEQWLKFKVYLPSLPEQRKIAEILSTWDEAIDLTEQLIAAKQRRKQALMQRLLTGQVRFPGFEGEWKEYELKDVCVIIQDGTHTTPKYVEKGIPFLSVENVTTGDITNTKYITLEEHKKISQRCKPQKGDLLLTRIGTLGRAMLVDWENEFSIYVSLALLRTNNLVIPKFLFYQTQSEKFQKDYISKSLQNAIPQKINLGDIKNVKVSVPSVLEQQKIASVLYTCDQELNLYQQKLTALRRQKQGLMQQLLTGKVRVQV